MRTNSSQKVETKYLFRRSNAISILRLSFFSLFLSQQTRDSVATASHSGFPNEIYVFFFVFPNNLILGGWMCHLIAYVHVYVSVCMYFISKNR